MGKRKQKEKVFKKKDKDYPWEYEIEPDRLNKDERQPKKEDIEYPFVPPELHHKLKYRKV